MSIEYPDLADFIAIAKAVTGIGTDILLGSANLDLADSALHAPQGGWGEFYPDFVDKAAVSFALRRTTLSWTATSGLLGVTLRLFVNLNGWVWTPYPGIDEAGRQFFPWPAGRRMKRRQRSGLAAYSGHYLMPTDRPLDPDMRSRWPGVRRMPSASEAATSAVEAENSRAFQGRVLILATDV